MASKSRPAVVTSVVDESAGAVCVRFRDLSGQSGDVYVWFDPRGGVNVEGDGESLVVHPRTGRSLRVVAGE